jgi:hypothetical protein
MNAEVQLHEPPSHTPWNQKGVIVCIEMRASPHTGLPIQRRFDQPVHAVCLRLEVRLLERVGIGGWTVRAVAISRAERVEAGIYPIGPALISDRGVQASQRVDGVAGMGIDKDQAVCRRQSGELVAALDELPGTLAYGRAVFGNAFIERHRRAAPTEAPEDDLCDARLFPEKLDADLHVERDRLEVNRRFVVVGTGVHTKDRESSGRQFAAGQRAHEVRCPVHHDDPHVGRGARRIGLVEGSLDRRRDAREPNVARVVLGLHRAGGDQHDGADP